MVDCKIALGDYNDKWIVGTPDSVKTLELYSEHVQIKYVKADSNIGVTRDKILKREEYHKHPLPIKECYLVLTGDLTVKIEGECHKVSPMHLFVVQPNKCHKVQECTTDIEYLTIRAPASDDFTKITCKKCDKSKQCKWKC